MLGRATTSFWTLNVSRAIAIYNVRKVRGQECTYAKMICSYVYRRYGAHTISLSDVAGPALHLAQCILCWAKEICDNCAVIEPKVEYASTFVGSSVWAGLQSCLCPARKFVPAGVFYVRMLCGVCVSVCVVLCVNSVYGCWRVCMCMCVCLCVLCMYFLYVYAVCL